MDTKTAARERFESVQDRLTELSHRIHSHPELGFEEEQASSWLCESLADAGFSVQKGICDLPTAFLARAGSGPLHVGICAEYDCLPGIGHACGHNIIAASAVGAALAAAKVTDEVGLTISVIGTPAEEVGNVSLAMPSILPMIGINSLPAVNHQPEFTAHCVTAHADKALADGALAMAWTCIDMATDQTMRDRLTARR
jgi:metal-dependent amidase/aminoacylase/carboxypeptidase family protein